MSFKRFTPSAALWFWVMAGMSLAGPAEATGYSRHHYYQPYGHYYPNHGYLHRHKPHYYGHGYRRYSYFGYPGSYCPPRGYYSHGYYQPLIRHGIGAIVT
ncbi:MAG: hypothetical protein ACREXR_15425, partial [Gammaproteobacteria bacterium]